MKVLYCGMDENWQITSTGIEKQVSIVATDTGQNDDPVVLKQRDNLFDGESTKAKQRVAQINGDGDNQDRNGKRCELGMGPPSMAMQERQEQDEGDDGKRVHLSEKQEDRQQHECRPEKPALRH